jgi:hypothetical protein
MIKFNFTNSRFDKSKKKFIIFFLLAWAVLAHVHGEGEELLTPVLSEKKWEQLPTLFLDDSHSILKDYFYGVQSIKIITSQPNQLIYKAKFNRQGEIGVIIFEKKDGKYLNLKIKNQIKPLYFVETLRKYRAANIKLTVGDARIHFKRGHFYETAPYKLLLIFKGRWRISIKPNDEEEKLTLKRKYKKDYFERSEETGIFILDKRDFLDRLPSKREIITLDTDTEWDEDVRSLFNMYQEIYGVNMKQFGEYWYLPFPKGSNLIIFEKDKKSYYYYLYNENLVPDTQLTESDTKNMLLSYNSYRGMKLSFGEPRNVSRLNVNLYFNPERNFISGTTSISYENPSNVRELHLKKGLQLIGELDSTAKGLNIFRKGERYFLMGTGEKRLSLYFRGHITPTEENLELFKPMESPAREIIVPESDSFYFLSRIQNFYPNPGEEFFESTITINIPGDLNCLASGNLVEKNIGNISTYTYSSSGAKGISLVTGNFKLSKKLDSRIPLHFYTYESFRYPRRLELSEIKEAFDFFLQRFGSLDLSTVNVLLKRGKLEGGVSNTGFVVVHLPPIRAPIPRTNIRTLDSPLMEKKIFSPILIRDQTEDHIMHELAHQWWGGLISWKSYQDVWITEGLAHFSVLYFLKNKLSKREFNRIVRKLRRWVYRFSDSGPLIYGTRINLLEDKYEAYQSVIYNKSALVFLMLMDLIGEEAFLQRLQSVVKEFKYRSLPSMQFIRKFSENNQMVLDFFKKWVFSRSLPVVKLELAKDDKEMDKEEHKKVVIRVRQLDTDFIFPLKLRVVTRKGTSVESIIVKAKKQKFTITRDASIRSIDVLDTGYPIKEKKDPPPHFYR